MRWDDCVRTHDRHRFSRHRISYSRSSSPGPRSNFIGEQGGLIAEPSESNGRLGLVDVRVAKWCKTCWWDG